MKYSLPARLDNVIDDVGVGAILKSLVHDNFAVVVECGNTLKVCRYRCKKGIEPTFDIENYFIEEIEHSENWIVLTNGYDYDISDNFEV